MKNHEKNLSFSIMWQVAYCSQGCINLHKNDHKGACDDAVRKKEEEERGKEVD